MILFVQKVVQTRTRINYYKFVEKHEESWILDLQYSTVDLSSATDR